MLEYSYWFKMQEIVIIDEDKGKIKDNETPVKIVSVTDLVEELIIGDFDKGIEESVNNLMKGFKKGEIGFHLKKKEEYGNTSAGSGSEKIYRVSYSGVRYY